MLKALYNDELIDIEDALYEIGSDKNYYCPYCHSKVLVCNGSIKLPYFAHSKNHSCDIYTNEDEKERNNEWHRDIQSLFPKQYREKIITKTYRELYPGDYEDDDEEGNLTETHIADVCIGKYVIEIQHSPMDPDTFYDRTVFYINAGYKLIWIFDYNDKSDREHIDLNPDKNFEYDNKNGTHIIIKYAPKTCMYVRPQLEEWRDSVYICYSSGSDRYLKHIVWAKPNNDPDDEDLTDYSKVVVKYLLGCKNVEALANRLVCQELGTRFYITSDYDEKEDLKLYNAKYDSEFKMWYFVSRKEKVKYIQENKEIYIKVPYKFKDIAKRCNAIWNPDKKSWYFTNKKDVKMYKFILQKYK